MFGALRNDFKWTKKSLTSSSLVGLNVIVIGGTSGLGQGISRELASKGANVTVVGRTFRDQDVKNISFVKADLTNIKTSIEVAKQLPLETTDMILFTTGIMAGGKRLENAEGIELDLAVSYLNRYAITKEIATRLGKNRTSSPSLALISRPRVFVMAFPGTGQQATVDDFNSEKNYAFMSAHSNTVASNEALVLDAVTRHRNLDFFGLNPGMMQTGIRTSSWENGLFTNLLEGVVSWFNPTVEVFSKNMVPLLVSPDLNNQSGVMFNQSAEAIKASANMTPSIVARIMEESEKLYQKALTK